MDIVSLLNNYGSPTSLKVGNFVLVEGFDDLNIFVIQCEILKIDGDKVEVKEVKKYYLSGRSVRGSEDINSYKKSDLLIPIRDRLIQQNDFIKWLANQF